MVAGQRLRTDWFSIGSLLVIVAVLAMNSASEQFEYDRQFPVVSGHAESNSKEKKKFSVFVSIDLPSRFQPGRRTGWKKGPTS